MDRPPKYFIENSIFPASDLRRRDLDNNVRLQARVRLWFCGKSPDQGKVNLDVRVWKAQEEERSAVNSAKVAAH